MSNPTNQRLAALQTRQACANAFAVVSASDHASIQSLLNSATARAAALESPGDPSPLYLKTTGAGQLDALMAVCGYLRAEAACGADVTADLATADALFDAAAVTPPSNSMPATSFWVI